MRGKLSSLGVNAIQRPFMDYLRTGGWVVISKLPFPVGQATIERVIGNGWVDRRGDGLRAEIKLTSDGLVALQQPV